MDKKYYTTKYERVRHSTNAFKGENKTIFDQFQKVVFPVLEIDESLSKKVIFKVVIVDTVRKEILLYDPVTPLDKNRVPIGREDKHLIAIASYVEQEYYDKSYLTINVADTWRLLRADCTNTSDTSMSSLYCCYYLYTILKGVRQHFFDGKEISKFHRKLKGMVKKFK